MSAIIPMKKQIELLAPGGDIDCIKAAIAAGADAVYCGLNKFNARNRAENIDFDKLQGILNLAHKNQCKVFLTLNILIVGSEIPLLVGVLNKLANIGIDGVIVQDLGLFYLVSKYFKGLKLHASTQLNTHNEGQIKFLKKLSATRVNLARELNIDEITALTRTGHENNVLTEVFVHGSYCISFSGICYFSSVHGGNSGNRGRCSQPCRNRFLTTRQGKNFPLNLKDNSAFFDLGEIAEAGVDSLKIEGRIKRSDYVYTVVDCWKKQLRQYSRQNTLNTDNSDLYKVFNRDFSNGYLRGEISKNMFIDNPRDHSRRLFPGRNRPLPDGPKEKGRIEYYEEKDEIETRVNEKISRFSIAKIPLEIRVSGKCGTPLTVAVTSPDISFTVCSATDLARRKKESIAKCLTHGFLLERFSAVNDTAYVIEHLALDLLENDLFIPFHEVTSLRKKMLARLNGAEEMTDPIKVPVLKKSTPMKGRPALGVLVSSQKELQACGRTRADIFFQLPGRLKNEYPGSVDLFLNNRKLIPWFPSVLMGEDYAAGVEFLEQVKPDRIVTNNTGIAYAAFEKGIPWIAGPHLNMVNAFGLLCLKETFNCHGAFVSNEISQYQIKQMTPPENFKLYYRIYHPLLLLTSRQCLLHQVTGCEKNAMDEDCMTTCDRSGTITHVKKGSFLIRKTRGNYPCLYNDTDFLNTDIVMDLPEMFSFFLVDLRQIKTETKVQTDIAGIIRLFEDLLKGKPGSKKQIEQYIYPTFQAQYEKGI